jgi:lysophospholipase L1-like esterase
VTMMTACGGSGGSGDDGGTVPLFSGAVPPAAEAIDLRPTSSGPIHDVAMVGDSITVASMSQLEDMASGLGVDLTIRAEVGRRIAEGSPPAPGTLIVEEVLADDTPDLWVIALGTNDLGKYSSSVDYQVPIDELLALIPPGVPVAWIDTYIEANPEAASQFDDALTAALRARGRATIGDWSDVATQEGMLSDGIHPTDDGAQRFATVVQGEIVDWLDQPT